MGPEHFVSHTFVKVVEPSMRLSMASQAQVNSMDEHITETKGKQHANQHPHTNTTNNQCLRVSNIRSMVRKVVDVFTRRVPGNHNTHTTTAEYKMRVTRNTTNAYVTERGWTKATSNNICDTHNIQPRTRRH
jgi:hypothetical protein